MRRRAMTLGALLAVVACVASRAAADPLRVVYRIDVFQKCTFVDNAIRCMDFRASFPLTLMFDSHVRSSRDSCQDAHTPTNLPITADSQISST